jgi:hypothetical protein
MVDFGRKRFMPLTLQGTFKAIIRQKKPNTYPPLIRWEFKIEPTQIQAISVRQFKVGTQETFFAKMNKDGRITIPKIDAKIIKTHLHKQETLNHHEQTADRDRLHEKGALEFSKEALE